MYGIETLAAGYARLFDVIEAWARSNEAVEAFFISGSVANNAADKFSDLDILVISEQSSIQILMAQIRSVLNEADAVIIENQIPAANPIILSVVTNEWHRIDVAFGDRESALLQQTLIPVYDPESLYAGAPAKSVPVPHTPDRLITISKEFLRVLGLSVVVLGRRDVHAAREGANLLRNMLIELFLMEPPARTRSSAKKLLPVLTKEQQSILTSLPPISDDHVLVVDFSSAIANVFLPRARELTEAAGGIWPIDVEDATRAYLAKSGTLEI